MDIKRLRIAKIARILGVTGILVMYFGYDVGCIKDEGPRLNHASGVSNLISKENAQEIASEDATRVYGDLSDYVMVLTLVRNEWHVKYKIRKDKKIKYLGGSPEYIIDAQTGKIIGGKYFQ